MRRVRHLAPVVERRPRRRRRYPGSAGRPTEIEKLRDDFARATGEPKKKALAEAIQARAFEIGTLAPFGEFVNQLASRRTLPAG